jgi:Amt family ammonium transporter
MMIIKKILMVFSFAAFTPAIVAQELNSGDTSWILTSTALVLFMTLPG